MRGGVVANLSLDKSHQDFVPDGRNPFTFPFNVSEWIDPPGCVGDKVDYGDTQYYGFFCGGLVNMGNSCFLNSVVQALTHCPALYLKAMECTHRRNAALHADKSFCGYCAFEKHVTRITSSANTRNIAFYNQLERDILRNHHIGGNEQNCAFETLSLFLDWLTLYSIPRNRKIQYITGAMPAELAYTSYIGQTFSSILVTDRKCQGCRRGERVYNVTRHLAASPKKDRQDLLSCLVDEMKPSTHDVDCDTCKEKHPKDYVDKIAIPPNNLIVAVRKLVWNSSGTNGGCAEKNFLRITVPRKLNIGCLVSDSNGYKSIDNTYVPYAGIFHEGSSASGHYVAVVKSPTKQWYLLDDELTIPIPEDAAFKLLNRAYLLFFHRKTPLPPPATAALPAGTTTQPLKSINLQAAFNKQPSSPSACSTMTGGSSHASDESISSTANMLTRSKSMSESSRPLKHLLRSPSLLSESMRRFFSRGCYYRKSRRRDHSPSAPRDLGRLKRSTLSSPIETESTPSNSSEESIAYSAAENWSEDILNEQHLGGTCKRIKSSDSTRSLRKMTSAVLPVPKRSEEDVEYDRGKPRKITDPRAEIVMSLNERFKAAAAHRAAREAHFESTY